MKSKPIFQRSRVAVLPLLGMMTGALAGQSCAADTNPLAKARTVRVKETFLTADTDGKLKPMFRLSVEVAGPRHVRVNATTARKKSKGAYYVAGVKTECEYYADDNNYRFIDPTPDGHASSQLRYVSCVDMILNGNGTIWTGKAPVTETEDILDGRPMKLQTEVQPPSTDQEGVSMIWTQKLWTDARTGLPYRRSAFVTQNGATKEMQELNFLEWTLDKPIPPSDFTFIKPAGAKELATPKLLTAGTMAPDFAAVTPDGKTIHLSDFRGKTVVLDFWATWCGPCKQAMPHLEHLYQEIKDKDVMVLALCVWDTKPKFQKWIAANMGAKYHFPVAFDPAGDDHKNVARTLYRVSGIPTQYVIDKEGRVSAAIVGQDKKSHPLEDNLHRLGIDLVVQP